MTARTTRRGRHADRDGRSGQKEEKEKENDVSYHLPALSGVLAVGGGAHLILEYSEIRCDEHKGDGPELEITGEGDEGVVEWGGAEVGVAVGCSGEARRGEETRGEGGSGQGGRRQGEGGSRNVKG